MLSNIFQQSQNCPQVIKMFAFVIATFLTCWFPYHAYFVYSYHNPEVELPIFSDYSFVFVILFVILFVINNLHHPGSPTTLSTPVTTRRWCCLSPHLIIHQ